MRVVAATKDTGVLEVIEVSVEKNKQLMHRYFEEFLNASDGNPADRVLAPSFICHMPGADTINREAYKQFILHSRAAFPDMHYQPDDMIAEEDQVAVRFTMTGTHQRPFQGLPPTGKKAEVLAICTYRIADDQIVEKWPLTDSLSLLRQIGALPRP